MKLKALFARIAKEQNVTPESFESRLDDFVADQLTKSQNLQVAFKVTPGEMDELYAEGYNHYMKEEYAAAYECFRWLAIFNPFEFRYWMGVGATLQLLEAYEKALQAYAMAAISDPKDPLPHFHAYECYSASSDPVEAQKALEDARERAAGHPLYSGLRQEIDGLLRGVKHA